jgi:hypothetical protein
VSIHHRRHRKTGPEHPIFVARCAVHGRAFSLYPPGWTPYGRLPLLVARPDRVAVGPPPLDDLVPTMFGAALDAAAGRAWPRDGVYGDIPRWGTQLGLLARLGLLVGIDSVDDIDHIHAVAQALGVRTQVIIDAARQRDAAGLRGRYRAQGAAIVSVVEALPAHLDVLAPLARIGHATGLWGPVFRVDGTDRRHLTRLARLRSNDFDP